MDLFRVHAYAVSPSRKSDKPISPEGGEVNITAPLGRVIRENIESARFEVRTTVDFEVDPATRTNAMRDLVLAFGFEKSRSDPPVGLQLAERLSQAMDQRSAPCLFVLAAFRGGDQREVYMWVFPRDAAFRLVRGRGGPSIEVLTDVFSQTSRLRKAAQFRGGKGRADFLSGQALDFQTGYAERRVADFWVVRFLECTFSIRGEAGTRMLAQAVRAAYENAASVEDKEAVFTAAMAARRTPQRRMSLASFADRYLADPVKKTFLEAAPNKAIVTSTGRPSRQHCTSGSSISTQESSCPRPLRRLASPFV